MLSATPVNLRNRDLFNLLSLLVPGEFEDLESLEERLAPNRVLHRITKSTARPRRDERRSAERGWRSSSADVFGSILTLRPDYALLRELLAKDALEPADAVQIKRLCSELHGLSAEVTRTRKVEVQEFKAMREPHHVPALFNDAEAAFYDAYRGWCVERAAVTGSPAALRDADAAAAWLAAVCPRPPARYWSGGVRGLPTSRWTTASPRSHERHATSLPVRSSSSSRAHLSTDTKFDQFRIAHRRPGSPGEARHRLHPLPAHPALPRVTPARRRSGRGAPRRRRAAASATRSWLPSAGARTTSCSRRGSRARVSTSSSARPS